MHARTFSLLLLSLMLLLVSTGVACRKRSANTASPQGEVVSQPGAAAKSAGTTEPRLPTQGDIYEATRKFLERNKRPANTPEELVAAGLLAPLPTPPPGKKYAIDQRAANLHLVDR